MTTRHRLGPTPDGIGPIARTLTIVFSLLALAISASCARAPQPSTARARSIVLITVDTLRADHIGAYGYPRARTPAIDRLAADGALFERAYAAAPITLPSHATILTGRYPPGHGARDNGMRMIDGIATLATVLHARGFRTAAFIAAFPLDHQFGLNRGFDVYGDRLPRAPNGRPSNERPAAAVVNDAIAWLRSNGILPSEPAANRQSANPQSANPQSANPQSANPQSADPQSANPQFANPQSPIRNPQFFLWVHLFEPHAPYGDPASGRSTIERYDEEIATADREIGRLLDAVAARRTDTVIVLAGDHGEAFGEHGEYAHSIFVYDTTLRVPLVMSGPGIAARVRIGAPVTLADVAPTILRRIDPEVRLKGGSAATDLGDVDGIDLAPALGGAALPHRELYAESFAPLIEFGWAPLRAVRADAWKLIAAPKPELFEVDQDPVEQRNRIAEQSAIAQRLADRANRYSAADLPTPTSVDRDAAERLRALGYASGSASGSAIRNPQSAMSPSASASPSTLSRPDPKDRRELAARIAQVTSGELTGAALVSALEGIVRDDPRNGQAHLRLAYAWLASGDCARAEPEFHAAASTGLPSADIYLGLATCLGRRNDLAGVERALDEARRLEPENPAVIANVGILRAAKGDHAGAIQALRSALAIDPDLHEARFNLALEYARSGRRADAAAAAQELLARLPHDAPQRAEVDRLLRAVR